MLIVSLTSIPPRFHLLRPTLDSLVAQRAPIDRIILYVPLAYRRGFADWDGALPPVPQGVEIRRTQHDYGPATKALPALRDFRGQDCDILICDDDRIYDPLWAQRFLDAKKRHPGCCIAISGLEAHWISPGPSKRRLEPRAVRRWRVTDWRFQLRLLRVRLADKWDRAGLPDLPRKVFKQSGYIDIFEGCCGVLLRPEHIDDEAYEIPAVLWTVDDVWLSGMVARKGIPIWLEGNVLEPAETQAEVIEPLVRATIDGVDRTGANAAAVDHMRRRYGIWR